MGNIEESKETLKKAMKFAEMSDNEPLIAACYSLFSQLMRMENQSDLAIEYSKRSLRIQEKLGNNEIIVDTLMSLVILNIDEGRKKEAEEYLKLLKEKAQKVDSTSYQYACMVLDAEIKGYEKRYNDAIAMVSKAIKYFEREKDFRMFWYSKLVLANTLISLNKIDSCEKEIKDVMTSAKVHNAVVPLIQCHLVLGAVNGYKAEFDIARENVEEAIKLSRQGNFIRYIADGRKLLETIEILEKAWKKYYKINEIPTKDDALQSQSLNLIKSYIKKAKKIVYSS